MDFVKISYTGRIEDKVFDTTNAEIAKREGIFDEKKIYKPLPIVIGEKQVIEGLDEALKKMKVGEKKTVEILPEKGYGKRDPSLVRLVPMKVFKRQKINPIPGMPIELDGRVARVQTVAGGRVRVDFNPDLAGKTLVFDVKIEESAKNDSDRVKYLLERSFNSSDDFEFKLTGKKLQLKLPKKVQSDRNLLVRKASFAAEAFKFLKLDEIDFSEVWENPEKKEVGKTEEKKKEE